MNRSVSFVLWFIPILFLVVDFGAEGSLGEDTFWFFVVAIFLFAARSVGITGEADDGRAEPPRQRAHEEIEKLGRVVEPYLLSDPSQFAVGLPFSTGILAIFGVHEFAHHIAARRHGMLVTLPYFIPVPVLFGTFGAFTGLKGRAKDRKALFDVAIAGPLAGLILALLALWLGLQSSIILRGPLAGTVFGSIGIDVGSSIMLALVSKLALGGTLLEGHRVVLQPLAYAGWLGMMMTALNLLPVGQLDGGYITHTLWGAKRANVVSIVGLIAVFFLAFFVSSWLLMWAFVIFFVASTRDLLPANDLTGIGPFRTLLGYFVLALLLLIILPVPGYFYPALRIHPHA